MQFEQSLYNCHLDQVRSCSHCLSTVGWCHHYFTNISENLGRELKKNALKVISQDAGQGFCSEMFLLFLLVLVLFPEFCCCATWRVNKVLKNDNCKWSFGATPAFFLFKMGHYLKICQQRWSWTGGCLLLPLSPCPCPSQDSLIKLTILMISQCITGAILNEFVNPVCNLSPRLVLPPQQWQIQTLWCSEGWSVAVFQTPIAQVPCRAGPWPRRNHHQSTTLNASQGRDSLWAP